MPALFTSRFEPRVPLEHRCSDALDGLAVGDVADLVLAVDLGRELAQPVLAPREQHAPPTARASARASAAPMPLDAPVTTAYRGRRGRSRARARRAAGRVARRPRVSVCLPASRRARRSTSTRRAPRRCPWPGRRASLPSKNVTVRERLRRVGRHEQRRRAPLDARAALGRSHVTVGPATPLQPERAHARVRQDARRRASCRSSTPGSRTRAPERRALPGLSAGAAAGSPKTAKPLSGS